MPPLPDVILEEIFLRLPPGEPASLLRASIASKFWLRELTGARFRGRYLEFHGAPPMLGFLYCRSSWAWDHEAVPPPDLVSTTGFRARHPGDGWGAWKYIPRDCRHGRVLLEDNHKLKRRSVLAVWDPMTGCRTRLVVPGRFWSHRATVLCGVAGCDHRACHGGPFRVVVVSMDRGVACAFVSSPETGKWSVSVPSLDLEVRVATIQQRSAVLSQDALYFLFTYLVDDTIRILKYDLCSARLSMFDAPAMPGLIDDSILLARQDGSLGFACLNHRVKLRLWSRHQDSDGLASWTQHRAIEVTSLLPVQDPNESMVNRFTLIGSIEDCDIIFVTTDTGIYEINIKSLRWKKLRNPEHFNALIPYMSFYIPQGKYAVREMASRL
ncbi:unnamed protein product [Alopecurus aequalis]